MTWWCNFYKKEFSEEQKCDPFIIGIEPNSSYHKHLTCRENYDNCAHWRICKKEYEQITPARICKNEYELRIKQAYLGFNTKRCKIELFQKCQKKTENKFKLGVITFHQ